MSNVAVLDCGSNSTRLLIVSPAGEPLVRDMRITRLSEAVDASGNLSPAACERVYETLRAYRAIMDDFDVARGLLVATSAVRDAANAATFLEHAADLCGVEARAISGTEEAVFSYEGATRSLGPDPRPCVIVDIGGGSSEVATRIDGEVRGFSMQIGCVRVTERALGTGIVTDAARVAAQSMIEHELDRAFFEVPGLAHVVGDARLVGLAGTVATLVQLEAGLATYERAAVHHRELSRATVQRWRDQLGMLTSAQRLKVPGMVPGREDVLVAGLYILTAVMDRFAVHEVLSSEDDILDGVAASLI